MPQRSYRFLCAGLKVAINARTCETEHNRSNLPRLLIVHSVIFYCLWRLVKFPAIALDQDRRPSVDDNRKVISRFADAPLFLRALGQNPGHRTRLREFLCQLKPTRRQVDRPPALTQRALLSSTTPVCDK